MDHANFVGMPDVGAMEVRTTPRKRSTVELYDEGQAATAIRVAPGVVEGRALTSMDRSITFRTVPVPSPTIVQRAMPHLQRLGVDGLLQHPWNITSAFASQEFLNFQTMADAYPTDHRLRKVSFNQEMFARLYRLPSTGYAISQDVDHEFLAQFFCKKGAPFGWHYDAVADPELSAVFQILNPIFTPERPHQIMKSIAMLVCKAWENQALKPDWAAYLWGNFCRLTEKKKRFFSPYLLHAYHNMDLLSLEENQDFENIQNGVVGFSGAKSRGRHKHPYARAAGGIRAGKVSRKSLPTQLCKKVHTGQGRGYISNHSRVHPVEVATSGVAVEKQATECGDREKSETRAASEFSQSDRDARDPLENLVREFGRQKSLLVSISRTLRCEGDEEVLLPKILDMCAAQEFHEKDLLALSSQVQQERARSERAEEQNNELRVRLTSLQSQFMKEEKAKKEAQDAQQMEIWKRQQQKAEDMRETNLWLKSQNDGLQLQIRSLLTQREEDRAAQEKELTATASLLAESEVRREGLATHTFSLQAEVDALRKRLEQHGQVGRTSVETCAVLLNTLRQMDGI